MDRSMHKWQKFLKQHPSLNSSSKEIEELPPNVSLEAITKETRSIRTNTTLSLPSEFKGETVPPVDPNLVCMSIIPRNCKIVNKATSLPDLFNLKFIEPNYVSDPQLSAIRDLIVTQDPEIHQKITQMSRYYAQFVNDFSVKENVVWMDDKLAIPINLQSAINNRIHAYHHGKSNMFDAAKDVWYPYIYRSIASIAEGCPECTAAGKNLKTLINKNQLGSVPEPKEPNESVQLDFWGHINYLNESSKYVLVAVDRFSRWPSAMVYGNNRSDKILKFLKSYISNHGVPRKIHIDQGTNFMSNAVKAFCNGEGIEIIKSPVNDHRATGCVERTIGSLKNSILAFAHEKIPEPLEKMVERALGALRFSKNSTLEISPFEAHHGREANTVLRNLTKKPSLQNLDWSRVIKTKNDCLDTTDPNGQDMPHPADTNWSFRSDLAYDIRNRTHARRLTVDQSENQDDEPSIRRSANPTGQPGPSGSLFQRTGNKNLRRYRQIHSKTRSESTHTLTLDNGVVLRKSGVATKPIPKKSKIAAKSVVPVPLSEVKKRAIQTTLPPPTPREVKERLTQRIAEKKRERTGRRFEETDSESEDSEDLPIISVKRAKQQVTTTPEARIERSATALPEAEVETDQDTIPARGGELDNQNPGEQGTSHPGDPTQPITTSKKKGASSKKARLVSYSSQGESQDETSSTTSRRSGRKRTAVTKMGGVMIDFINQNKEGNK